MRPVASILVVCNTPAQYVSGCSQLWLLISGIRVPLSLRQTCHAPKVMRPRRRRPVVAEIRPIRALTCPTLDLSILTGLKVRRAFKSHDLLSPPSETPKSGGSCYAAPEHAALALGANEFFPKCGARGHMHSNQKTPGGKTSNAIAAPLHTREGWGFTSHK